MVDFWSKQYVIYKVNSLRQHVEVHAMQPQKLKKQMLLINVFLDDCGTDLSWSKIRFMELWSSIICNAMRISTL